MSYDVWLAIDTGAPEPATVAECGNYTSNVSGMWLLALGLPERPCYQEDGSPRMGSRLNRDTGTWEPVHVHDHGLRVLHGAPCSEAAGVLARAVERMRADPDLYRPMEPSNGWGDYEGALAYLDGIAQACATHPKATVYVSS